ncbi:2'-5' RNA ligase family protein [Microbacterium sp. 22242]|uniref:2'-5' RNA ligase family protein n=1 Tax=Microbacterium sp. 22242 TaxID=3453896 RepID=UPI003F860DBA
MQVTGEDVERTRDHWWWRPGWAPGARYLTFHLTFEDADVLHDAAGALAPSLRVLPAVDPVPVEWLHLTMTGVGFTTDVAADALEACADGVFARASQLAPEPLRFPRAFVYPQGVGIATAPAAWLDDLRAIQLDEVGRIREVGGDSPFQPHVTLAYFSGETDPHAVAATVRQWHAEEVVVAHPRLSLIELGRDDRVYTWRVVRQVSLG